MPEAPPRWGKVTFRAELTHLPSLIKEWSVCSALQNAVSFYWYEWQCAGGLWFGPWPGGVGNITTAALQALETVDLGDKWTLSAYQMSIKEENILVSGNLIAENFLENPCKQFDFFTWKYINDCSNLSPFSMHAHLSPVTIWVLDILWTGLTHLSPHFRSLISEVVPEYVFGQITGPHPIIP